jgi:DNA (cytosine-5)-methyltransferase 1
MRCSRRRPPPIGVYGDHPQEANYRRPDGTRRGRKARTLNEAHEAMGIDWMGWSELTQAIPPAFTQFIGEQIMAELQAAA